MNKKAAKGASIVSQSSALSSTINQPLLQQQADEEEWTEDTPLLAKANVIKPPSLFSGLFLTSLQVINTVAQDG